MLSGRVPTVMHSHSLSSIEKKEEDALRMAISKCQMDTSKDHNTRQSVEFPKARVCKAEDDGS